MWYHVCWPRLTAKRVEPVVSISWTSCWTTYTNFDNNCCQRYIATCEKKNLYRCTSTFSALNYCCGIFFKSLSYLYEVVRTHFSANFWTFRNFDRNFLEFVAPSSDENENHILPLKARFLLKKRWKPHQNRAINHHTILVQLCTARQTQSMTKNKNQTQYFCIYNRRA